VINSVVDTPLKKMEYDISVAFSNDGYFFIGDTDPVFLSV
jgi:hypothetical protein